MPSSSAPIEAPGDVLAGALAARAAPEVAVAGNTPLALAPAGAGWLVLAGAVEVFAAAADGAGARLRLGTARAGAMVFGAPPVVPSPAAEPGASLGLLAAGLPGTRLAAAGGGDLAALARQPAAAAALAEAVDGWLGLLFAEVPRGSTPQVFVEIAASDLRAGAPGLDLAPGQAARPRGRAAWIEIESGPGGDPADAGPAAPPLLLGEPALPLAAGGAWPLPGAAWIVAGGPARLTVSATRERLAAGDLWDGLDRFHRLFLLHVAGELARATRADRHRLGLRAELDRRLLSGAYGRLASVLVPVEAQALAVDEDTPLLAACRLVGAAQGIAIRDPASMGDAGRGDPLVAIALASQARRRRVILRDDWWRRDNGPLVGQLVDGDERRPVALLPTSPASYDLVDPAAPAERRRRPVDAQLAESIAGDATMFYTPFTAGPLRRRDLLAFALRGRRRDLLTIVFMGLGGGLLALLLPVVTGEVFGDIIPGADRPRLLVMTLALIASALAAAAFQITRSIAVLRLGGRIDGTLQSAVWDRLLSLPVSFFRRFTVGDLAVRSMGVDTIRDLLTGNVLTSLLAVVFSLTSFALLFVYSPRLALLASGLIAVLLAVTAALIWLQLRYQREILELEGKLASLLFGLINGIDKLHLGGAEERAFALWAERFAAQRRRTLQAQRAANVQAAFSAVYGVFTSLAIFALAGSAPPASLSVGDFLAFNVAFGQFLGAALAALAILSSILAMVPLYERLAPILTAEPEIDAAKADAGELAGAIEFGHVSFRYQDDGPLILDDVSFHAAPGEFVALVGPSGAGKSTCLRLLLGFEKATAGSIYFDGQDLASLSIHSVRRQLGVVLQTGRPMVGDIYSNIVGSARLPLEDAWEAARMAGIEEDIRAMPMGMHTVVSEGGGTFSGGQKQRLLIARAVVRRPRIILFDEATSALDNRTQELVSASLARLKATRIVIAHRLSTIVGADRIYVMDGGRVVESGAYRELLAQGGLFARLAARQIV